jgi:hypothetical protein
MNEIKKYSVKYINLSDLISEDIYSKWMEVTNYSFGDVDICLVSRDNMIFELEQVLQDAVVVEKIKKVPHDCFINLY